MKHGQEISFVWDNQHLGLDPDCTDEDAKLIWSGLSMSIGLYRYIHPCYCEGEVCECDG